MQNIKPEDTLLTKEEWAARFPNLRNSKSAGSSSLKKDLSVVKSAKKRKAKMQKVSRKNNR